MSESAVSVPVPLNHPATRWFQLAAGLIGMMAISTPQYVWTFTKRSAARWVPRRPRCR